MPRRRKIVRRRTSTKKITRRRRKSPKTPNLIKGSVADLDHFYKVINRVQLAREETSFFASIEDSAIYENILNDTELPFKKKPIVLSEIGNCYEYVVSPGKERSIDDDTEEPEEFPDELPEDGQIFF
jgi:hypothetical protein